MSFSVKESRKTWCVEQMVLPTELEDTLNALSADGYQIFKVETNPQSPGAYLVIAFDPVQVMKGIQVAQAGIQAEIMAKFTPGG